MPDSNLAEQPVVATDITGADAAGPQLLTVEDAADGTTHHLTLIGELDLASTPLLEQRIKQFCDDGATEILLDLSRLAFMDSTGLRVILNSAEVCQRYDCEFSLTPGPPAVQRVFEITGMLKHLPFTGPTATSPSTSEASPRDIGYVAATEVRGAS
jgi:anti-sigma B factor antagonist